MRYMIIGCMLSFLLVVPATASAEGAGATSYTQTFHNVTQTYHAGSLKTFGAKLTPQQIAEIVWKAAHGKKVHWKPGLLLKTLDYLGGAVDN